MILDRDVWFVIAADRPLLVGECPLSCDSSGGHGLLGKMITVSSLMSCIA